jgi:hypothetical protein
VPPGPRVCNAQPEDTEPCLDLSATIHRCRRRARLLRFRLQWRRSIGADGAGGLGRFLESNRLGLLLELEDDGLEERVDACVQPMVVREALALGREVEELARVGGLRLAQDVLAPVEQAIDLAERVLYGLDRQIRLRAFLTTLYMALICLAC